MRHYETLNRVLYLKKNHLGLAYPLDSNPTVSILPSDLNQLLYPALPISYSPSLVPCLDVCFFGF